MHFVVVLCLSKIAICRTHIPENATGEVSSKAPAGKAVYVQLRLLLLCIMDLLEKTAQTLCAYPACFFLQDCLPP